MNGKIILSIVLLLFCNRYLHAATSEIVTDRSTFAGALVGIDLTKIGAPSEKKGDGKFIKKKHNAGRDARRYRKFATSKRAA